MEPDILERLSEYNPPDRVNDEARGIAIDIQDAKNEIERLRKALNKWWEYSQTDHEDHAKMMLDWADAVEATRSALQQKESE